MKEKRLFKIHFEYFKPSGKFYSEGDAEMLAQDCGNDYEEVHYPICYMQDIVDEVKKMMELPGLSGKWDGPIHISCEQGYPVLIPQGEF